MRTLCTREHLLALEGLGLSAKVGGGGARALEEAGEERLEEGVEDNGGTAEREGISSVRALGTICGSSYLV